MNSIIISILIAKLIVCSFGAQLNVDICVYGGTSAGVMAAYKAKKLGKTVVLVEPGKHLGGITSGGLGFTDYGDRSAIVGLAKDFYLRIGEKYSKKSETFTFEPHVAEVVFKSYITEVNVNVLFDHRITSAQKVDQRLDSIVVENSTHPQNNTNVKINAKMFIDCSYEGDLMARANITYTFGKIIFH